MDGTGGGGHAALLVAPASAGAASFWGCGTEVARTVSRGVTVVSPNVSVGCGLGLAVTEASTCVGVPGGFRTAGRSCAFALAEVFAGAAEAPHFTDRHPADAFFRQRILDIFQFESPNNRFYFFHVIALENGC